MKNTKKQEYILPNKKNNIFFSQAMLSRSPWLMVGEEAQNVERFTPKHFPVLRHIMTSFHN